MSHKEINRDERNCLSWWYPRIASAVPTPRTKILTLSYEVGASLAEMLDGEWPSAGDVVHNFVVESGAEFGYPLFLRTGLGSGKHDWTRTCYVQNANKALGHIAALVEWSHEVDLLGLPHNVWACREMLAVSPLFHCAAYGDMPVVREWRFFVNDGHIACVHPYWPTKALERGRPSAADWRDALGKLHDLAPAPARALASKVAQCVRGYWSVDVLEGVDGYFVTDMALGECSWHWPECDSVYRPHGRDA